MIFFLDKSFWEQNHLELSQLYQEQMKFSKGSNACAKLTGEKFQSLYSDLNILLHIFIFTYE